MPGAEDYSEGDEPPECETITRTTWRTSTVVDIVTSYRPTTIPETVRQTETNVITEENTITDLITTTLPGSTVVRTITITEPASTVTETKDGTTVTQTQPASTVVTTTTEVLPGETLIITPLFEVTLCPRPTGSPQKTLNPKSDRTFGCAPGYVCNPPKPNGCNFWPEPPTDNYECAPEQCIVAPPFINTTWKEDKSSYYPPSYGYFNLNPEAFGLSYDIFEFQVVEEIGYHTTKTITTGNWESQATLSEWPRTTSTSTTASGYDTSKLRQRRAVHWLGKRELATPNICYDSCDGAYKIAESIGKNEDLCKVDSDFRIAYDACAVCVDENSDESKKNKRDYVDPIFAQFFEYCDTLETTPTSSSSSEDLESQVTSREVSTGTQESAIKPTVSPIEPSTTTKEASSTSSSSAASSTAPSTTSSPAEDQPSSTASQTTQSAEESETKAAEPSDLASESGAIPIGISTGVTTIVTTTTDADGNVITTTSTSEVVFGTPIPGSDETPISTGVTTFAVTTTDSKGNTITTTTTSALFGVLDNDDDDEEESSSSPAPSETPSAETTSAGGAQSSETPMVVPPQDTEGPSPTPGEPESPTPGTPGPVPVPTTGAASIVSTSSSAILVTLLSMIVVFFA